MSVEKQKEDGRREFAATVLFEAVFSTDEAVAAKYRITSRTIRNYRRRLDEDLPLAGALAAKRRAFERAAGGLPPALLEAVETLEREASAARAGREISPEALEGVALRLRAVLGALPAGRGAVAAAFTGDGRKVARPAHEKW